MGRNSPSAAAVLFSIAIHSVVIGWVVFWGPVISGVKAQPTSAYDRFIAPQEKKIVWYPLRDLAIEPAHRIGTDPIPKGREKAKNILISITPESKPSRQIVWRPDAERVEKEIPAPDLVAVEAPARSPKPRKAFVPPPPIKPVDLPQSDLPVAPSIQTNAQAPLTLPASVLVRRRFLQPVSPTQTTAGSPISLQEPDSAAAAAGAANAAVLNASPADNLIGAIINGSHGGQISMAPTVGAPSSGTGGSGAGLQIPGLMARSGNPPPLESAPKVPPTVPRTIYEETRIPAVRSTLSIPLRPSSRTIPQSIESRFRGRVVYSMIVAKPKMALYAGDWVLWFAEKAPGPGDAPQIRAPLPARKFEQVSDEPQIHPVGKVQLSASIAASGLVDSVLLLNGAANPANQAAVRDFLTWQFAPALRNGTAIAVDVIVEIPFQ